MNTITGIILTKNEEHMISDCLASLEFCDEIIIIDSGSTDKTVSLARAKNVQVYEDLSSDFSHKRNVGREKAAGEWLLYVDADERVSGELVESIKYHVASNEKSEISAYTLKRKNFYLGNHE